jgi:hypothetical protein
MGTSVLDTQVYLLFLFFVVSKIFKVKESYDFRMRAEMVEYQPIGANFGWSKPFIGNGIEEV